MRTRAEKIQDLQFFIGFAMQQQPIRQDMTFPNTIFISDQNMITIDWRKWFVVGKLEYNFV